MSESSLAALLPPLQLLLLGFGNVAQALIPLLVERSEWLGRELGIRPVISGIGTLKQGYYIHPEGIDPHILAKKDLHWFMSKSKRTKDPEAFIQIGKTAGASLLIELTTLNPHNGQPALSYIRSALSAGLDVITANKGPVAYAQTELQALARRHRTQFRFEATVMDGLPLINLSQFTLQSAHIYGFRALLNSTSSYILSQIEQGYSFNDAVLRAQQLGIAEADPSYDIDGWDAVMKTTILANTLLEGQVTPDMIKREGIRNLSHGDIYAAALGGSPIRLVSQAKKTPGAVCAEVRPQRIEDEDILCVAKGATSVITLETEAMGHITLVEHESTVKQTAYGILSDLITIVSYRLDS